METDYSIQELAVIGQCCVSDEISQGFGQGSDSEREEGKEGWQDGWIQQRRQRGEEGHEGRVKDRGRRGRCSWQTDGVVKGVVRVPPSPSIH